MSLLVETIKVNNGRLCSVDYHSLRFNRSRKELFNIEKAIDLATKVRIPAYANKGLFKCRIEYDDQIRSIEFIPYTIKKLRTLRMVEAGDMEYNYKYVERPAIEKLMTQKDECDDILIVKDGSITDISYANIIVRGSDNIWYTPSTYLLRGTKREYLLDKGIIKEKEITASGLREFKELRLINSMIDIDDTDSILVRMISF